MKETWCKWATSVTCHPLVHRRSLWPFGFVHLKTNPLLTIPPYPLLSRLLYNNNNNTPLMVAGMYQDGTMNQTSLQLSSEFWFLCGLCTRFSQRRFREKRDWPQWTYFQAPPGIKGLHTCKLSWKLDSFIRFVKCSRGRNKSSLK